MTSEATDTGGLTPSPPASAPRGSAGGVPDLPTGSTGMRLGVARPVTGDEPAPDPAPGAAYRRLARESKSRLAKRFSSWTLRRRLLLLFTFVGLALAASIGIVSAAVVHLNDTVRTEVDRIDPAQVAAEDFLNAMVNQETGVRGYVITKSRSFLQPYTAGEVQELVADSQLTRALSGEPALESDLGALAQAARTWQQGAASKQIGDIAAARYAAARSAFTSAVGKAQFDDVRFKAAKLLNDLAARHSAADSAIADADRILVALLILALLLLLLAVEGTLFSLSRWMMRPMAQVATDARTVAAGALEHSIQLGGPPDIEAIARDVDSMRLRMLTDLASVEEARRLLAEQAELLRRSNSDLEEFAYVASHDLQEPLRKISSFSDLITRRYEDKLDSKGKEYLTYLADGARRMQTLINDVLELARVGREAGPMTAVDCAEAARTAVSNLSDELSANGATVTVRELPVVEGDQALIVALFQNLLSNSIKFRSLDPPHIVIEASLDSNETIDGAPAWRFCVRDNGIGIDPAYAERVFAMFQRLHRRDTHGGTGIGLALCRRIVEHHGGRIWVEQPPSGKGPGTAICWTLSR